MTGLLISAGEWDVASAAGRIQFTRPNVRAVRCVREKCRRLIAPRIGRRVFLDGHVRGFACVACQWGVLERTVRG